MKKNFIRLLSLFVLVQISIICLYSTYAWFSDKTNPSINEENIKVTSAEGLVIKLSKDSEARTSVNLNEILSDFEKFSLKQMSSSDGINFYTINFGAGLAHSAPEFIKIPVQPNGLINMKTYGMIDYNFFLETEDLAKHVYLHKDTIFDGIASSAIRLAVTIMDGNSKKIYIFGDKKENAIDGYETKAVYKTGKFSYSNIDPSFTTNQIVSIYSDYDGGRGQNDNDPVDLNKILFTLDANTMKQVNIKIWLEGGDVDCNTTLSDTMVNALIKFGSANVLADPPVISANNVNKTINGLTTDMEYAFTNTSTTIWQPVNNVSMTFNKGDTVYVRYKEIPGVSPCSYASKVVFAR